MLNAVRIKNFRSCDDVLLHVGQQVSALVGKNGVGKTSLLHGIQLAADLAVGESDPTFSIVPRDRTLPTELELTFTIGHDTYFYRVARDGVPSSINSFEELLLKNDHSLFNRNGETLNFMIPDPGGTLRIGSRASSLSSLLQILPEEATSEFKLVAQYLRAIKYYPLLQNFQEHSVEATSFIEAQRYEMWKAHLTQGRASRSILMRLIHMGLVEKNLFDELKTLLGENGLGLISDIRVEEIKLRRTDKLEDAGPEPAYTLFFRPGKGLAGSGNWFRFGGLSAGTSRIIQLLTYLIFDKSSCMLLEQPEDCIHAGLLAKVVDILKTYSEKTQLICTTHSPRVINLVGAAGVRFVTAQDGRTVISELTSKQVTDANTYISDEGTLADFLDTL